MTNSPIDLDAPIWSIKHVAAAFGKSIDTAREYTYRDDFPAPRALFSDNLWTRSEVLAWFDNLPRRTERRQPAASSKSPSRTQRVSHSSTTATGVTTKRLKSYRPRG